MALRSPGVPARIACAALLSGALLLAGCANARLATSIAEDQAARVSTPAAVYPRDFHAIRVLLAARAKAVVNGDEAAFMASVDKTSSSFYDAQKVQFENLQALPVSAMSYEVGNYGLTNATGIEGGALLSPEVVEHVYFPNTDMQPVANEVAETFVKRSGHWLLAADVTPATQANGVTARPWAGPRIDVVTSGHLIVVADASTPGSAADVMDTVEGDLRFDADILEVPVDDHVLVDATTSGAISKFDNDEEAGAITFGVPAGKNFETTGLAGLRIKINPAEIPYLSQEPVLLRHELTHYLLYEFAGRNPKWLTEGIAEYVSHQPLGLSSEQMTVETYNRLMSRDRDLTVSGLFGTDPDTDYPLAMACVTYLAEHGGIGKLKTLMHDYAAYGDAPYEDSHTDQVLQKVYGMSGGDVARGAFAPIAALH